MKSGRLFLLLQGGLLLAVPAAWPEKYALLIGINDYQAFEGPPGDLRGCENDVALMGQLLVDQYGFTPRHIRTLRSPEATREGIERSFHGLAQQVSPDDTVLVHFSGHGSWLTDDDGDEEDGRDETLCPADVKPGGEGAIRDDELGAWLQKIPTKHLTVVLDCCHSGTATRGLDDLVLTRNLPREERSLPTRSGEPEAGESQPQRERSSSPPERQGSGYDASLSYVLITACRADQRAADATFETVQPRKLYRAGALTWNLVHSLRQAGPAATCEEVHREVSRRVRQRFAQTPQLEGNFQDRPFLSPGSASSSQPEERPAPYLTITALAGTTATLNVGAVHGVTVGSEYVVFPPNETAFDGPGQGRIRVVATEAQKAQAEVIDGIEIRPGCRAVEVAHHFDSPSLFLRLGDFPPSQKQALAQSLTELGFLIIVEAETVVDRFLAPDPTLGLWGARLFDAGGGEVRRYPAATPDQLMAPLTGDLEKALALKRLAGLENPTPPFQIRVWTNHQDGVYHPGDEVIFFFEAEVDCYLTLIDLGTSGKVHVLFPNPYMRENRVQAGRTYSVPPEGTFRIQVRPPGGREMVRAIATLEPVDLLSFDLHRLETLSAEVTAGLTPALGRGFGVYHQSLLPTAGWSTAAALLWIQEE